MKSRCQELLGTFSKYLETSDLSGRRLFTITFFIIHTKGEEHTQGLTTRVFMFFVSLLSLDKFSGGENVEKKNLFNLT